MDPATRRAGPAGPTAPLGRPRRSLLAGALAGGLVVAALVTAAGVGEGGGRRGVLASEIGAGAAPAAPTTPAGTVGPPGRLVDPVAPSTYAGGPVAPSTHPGGPVADAPPASNPDAGAPPASGAPPSPPVAPGPVGPPGSVAGRVSAALSAVPTRYWPAGWRWDLTTRPCPQLGAPPGSVVLGCTTGDRSWYADGLASADGATVEYVAAHELFDALGYELVGDTNDWAALGGWPAAFSAQVGPPPAGGTVVDAYSRCLATALGRSTAGERDAWPCPANLASWVLQQTDRALMARGVAG